MPVYLYQCENCGVRFEQKQKFTDNPLVTCPECGKKSLRKVFQPVNVVFKGSGFYSTDHKSPSGMSASSKNEEKPPSTEKTSTPETNTKSESTSVKTETKEAAPSISGSK
jgi:putative FmdB family regulatory protein